MKPERLSLYLRALADLSEAALGAAFKYAVQNCKFIPTIAELRQWAQDFALKKHQQQAQQRTKEILALPAKPDDWSFKLEDAWDEIERRRDEQEAVDLAYIEPFTDEEIETALKLGKPYPGKDNYVDWVRRREARERRDKGIPRPSARKQLGPLFQNVMAAATRQPGDEIE